MAAIYGVEGVGFQSTLPAGEATNIVFIVHSQQKISIHASRGGSDSSLSTADMDHSIFQSTLPAGEATVR